MGYISDFGIMSAARTAVSAGLAGDQPIGAGQRFARRLGAAMMVVAVLPGVTPVSTLDVGIDKLRSNKGELRVCLTADPKNFPGCVDDAHAVTRSVPATLHQIHFEGLAPGDYAVAVIHDANGNNRLDTVLGIPREGFGFSRNPIITFGPPRFAAAEFTVKDGPVNQRITMRYLL